MTGFNWIAPFLLFFLPIAEGGDIYTVDDSPGLGRVFDGIGGLSGGGVRSDSQPFPTLRV